MVSLVSLRLKSDNLLLVMVALPEQASGRRILNIDTVRKGIHRLCRLAPVYDRCVLAVRVLENCIAIKRKDFQKRPTCSSWLLLCLTQSSEISLSFTDTLQQKRKGSISRLVKRSQTINWHRRVPRSRFLR